MPNPNYGKSLSLLQLQRLRGGGGCRGVWFGLEDGPTHSHLDIQGEEAITKGKCRGKHSDDPRSSGNKMDSGHLRQSWPEGLPLPPLNPIIVGLMASVHGPWFPVRQELPATIKFVHTGCAKMRHNKVHQFSHGGVQEMMESSCS